LVTGCAAVSGTRANAAWAEPAAAARAHA